MGSFTKWLGVGLGFTLGGPIGAIIGFAIGSFVDGLSIKDYNQEQIDYKKERNKKVVDKENTAPGDFEISLLVLAAVVIKSDGNIDQRELDFVRLEFTKLYGKNRANNAFKLFKGIVKKQISSRQVCIQIRENMQHAARLQLIHFLFGIAKADDFVAKSEIEEIRKIAGYLYINTKDFESIMAMFYDEVDTAYKILEIDKFASNDDIKKAYRKMVKKYHPDKLLNLGEAHLKGAKEKFQSIQDAYESLKNERGF